MSKLFRTIAGILAGVFAVLIFGLMVSLTYAVLGRLFPGSWINQLWGLVLFDLGALVWFVVFLGKSEGAGQRAISLLLFVASLIGTVAMVSSEVLLGGQSFVAVSPTVGRVVVWVFIGATAVHLMGVYAHHALSPGVLLAIRTQDLKDDLSGEAMADAASRFAVRKGELGAVLANRIELSVLNDLALPVPARLAGELFGAPVAVAPTTEGNPTGGGDLPG